MVFGRVLGDSMLTVRKLEAVATGPNNRPKLPCVITQVRGLLGSCSWFMFCSHPCCRACVRSVQGAGAALLLLADAVAPVMT